ncbi:MAG: pyrroline-5-carboxylate reductase [Lentisphaerae bacterium RIFOXYA12_FULL_48_11]|nr:MAG: pyrroline-5-carboxylate reductase [Lentisphaerae bacterium RIFOXYA12_FULL_48_11]
MKVGFIGAGNMAEAMIASLITSKILMPHEISVSDISADRRGLIKQSYRVNVYSKNQVIPGVADILFLAVKPQQLSEVLGEIASNVGHQHLVISIVAGKKVEFIQSQLPQVRVIRVMPNLPCTVSEAMSVFCMGGTANTSDRQIASKLLSSFGKVLELPEERFDAVTALSGSGPAFFSYFLNQMVDASVKEGLSREDALMLACQTMLGTSRLLIEKNLDPVDLIKTVTSAKGTTAAGLAVLDKSDVSAIVSQTIRAAARRSSELSAS